APLGAQARVTSTTNTPLVVSNFALYVGGACSRSEAGFESDDCANTGAANMARIMASVRINRQLVIILPVEDAARFTAQIFSSAARPQTPVQRQKRRRPCRRSDVPMWRGSGAPMATPAEIPLLHRAPWPRSCLPSAFHSQDRYHRAPRG